MDFRPQTCVGPYKILEALYAKEAKKRQATSTGGATPQLVEQMATSRLGKKSRDLAAEKYGLSCNSEGNGRARDKAVLYGLLAGNLHKAI